MKVSMPTGKKVKSRNKMDVSSTHITTMSMTQLRPTNILYGIKGDKFNVNYGQFTRLSPLVAPTYGSFQLKTYAFWVPLKVIWSDYQNYMENTPDASLAPSALNFSGRDYYDLLINSQLNSVGVFAVQYKTSDSFLEDENYDVLVYKSTTEEYVYYKLTARGRQLQNLMIGLGYEMPTYWNTSQLPYIKRFSLLPLLAYARCMYDYIYPSAYVQQQAFGYLFSEQIYEKYNEGQLTEILFDIERLCFVPYTQSYWTSLWAKPNQVAVGSNASDFTGGSISSTGYQAHMNVNENHAYITQGSQSDTLTLTAYGLRLLQMASDFCLRNNIGGTRFHEWMKAHTGWVSQEQDSTRSKFVKSWVDGVEIQDVTNVTTIGVMGEQAGKGYTSGGGSLNFECKENGFLIFVSMIVPQIGYYQGLKVWCKSIDSREDLYIDDFDSLGMVGIPRKYLYNCPHKPSDVTKFGNSEDAFGYGYRYSLFKIGNDYLSGDFRLGSRNADLDSYHTFRDVTYGRDNLNLDAQFLHVDNQYQRVFSNMGEEIAQGEFEQLDTFFTIFRYDVKKTTDMLSISESMPFFDRSGDFVNVDYEGNQL